MICYLDKTFCVSPNCKCERKLTNKIRKAAEKWWGGKDVPIAVGYLCGKDNCTNKIESETNMSLNHKDALKLRDKFLLKEYGKPYLTSEEEREELDREQLQEELIYQSQRLLRTDSIARFREIYGTDSETKMIQQVRKMSLVELKKLVHWC